MSTPKSFRPFLPVRRDIFALVMSLSLAGCAENRQPSGNGDASGSIDAGVEAGTPTTSNSDGPASDRTNSCTGDFRTWRYETSGCGAGAPAPVCGAAFDAGCLLGYICTCAGKWEPTCYGVTKEPWSYLVPQNPLAPGQAPVTGAPCDPTVVPDGGVR
jgi:hypothetical protein